MWDDWWMINGKIFKCKTSSISITSGLSRDPKRGPFLGWDWPEKRKVRQRLQIEQIELGKKFFLWNGSFFIMTLSFAFCEYCFYWSTKIDSYQGQTTKLYICNLHLVNVSLIVSSSAVMRTSMLYISSTWMRTIASVKEENKIDGEWRYFFLGDQLFFPHMNLSAWEPPWSAPNQHFSNDTHEIQAQFHEIRLHSRWRFSIRDC